MSSSVTLDAESFSRASQCSAHIIPCQIGFNGQAKVDEYFKSSIKQADESQGQTATLRGRPLDGELKQVPSGYTGIVVKESRKTFTDEEERNFTVTNKFSSYHYWNLDKKPSQEDKLSQVLEWIDVAKVLHAPVSTEDTKIKSENN